MNHQKVQIVKKQKGNDGYKTFSVGIKEETVRQLDSIAAQSDGTRNE